MEIFVVLFVSVCVFNVQPKTALLLPVWPRDSERLHTPDGWQWSPGHASLGGRRKVFSSQFLAAGQLLVKDPYNFSDVTMDILNY